MEIQQKTGPGIFPFVVSSIVFIFILCGLQGAFSCFHAMQRREVHDHLSQEQTKTQLMSLVQAIEDYKIRNGHYPESLDVLKKSLPKDSPISVYDPSTGGKRYFYYEVVSPEHYYLLGVGPDGQPFTADDIIPEVAASSQNGPGLLIKK